MQSNTAGYSFMNQISRRLEDHTNSPLNTSLDDSTVYDIVIILIFITDLLIFGVCSSKEPPVLYSRQSRKVWNSDFSTSEKSTRLSKPASIDSLQFLSTAYYGSWFCFIYILLWPRQLMEDLPQLLSACRRMKSSWNGRNPSWASRRLLILALRTV